MNKFDNLSVLKSILNSFDWKPFLIMENLNCYCDTTSTTNDFFEVGGMGVFGSEFNIKLFWNHVKNQNVMMLPMFGGTLDLQQSQILEL